jgi:probable rRNA maturation factor
MEPPPGPSPSIVVEVSDRQGLLAIDPSALAGLARRVLAAEGVREAAISLSLVDDATIHALNRRHLGHDWPTDVITFALSEPENGEPLAAEIVLSAEMAATTAQEAGVDPSAELALYLVHGLLHLCGQDDLSPEAARSMRRREDEHLRRENIMNTYSRVGAAPGGPSPASPGARGGAR